MRRFLALLLCTLVSSVAFAGASVPSTKLFDRGSIRVKDTDEVDKFLSQIGEQLQADKNRTLMIRVHSDERLGLMSNVYMADERAKRLVKELRKRGARKKQLFQESVGHNGVENTRETSIIVFQFSDDGGPRAPAPAQD